MNPETLEQIHMKIAFLERANADLGDVVFRQYREIQVLASQLEALSQRLTAALAEGRAHTPEEERPPHY